MDSSSIRESVMAFPHVNAELADQLLGLGELRMYDAGELVITEGRRPDYLGLVLKGSLGVRSDLWPDDRMILVGAHEVIGDLSMLQENTVASASVETLEPSAIFSLEFERLREELDRPSAFSNGVLLMLLHASHERFRNREISSLKPIERPRERNLFRTPIGPVDYFGSGSASADYDKAKQAMAAMPVSLRDAIASWVDDPEAAQRVWDKREKLFSVGTLSSAALGLLLDVLRELSVSDLPDRVIEHEPSFSAAEKSGHTGGHEVQKTVTLLMGGNIFLLTSPVDYKANSKTPKLIARQVGLPSRAARSCYFNPPEVDPEIEYGLLRGIVSPFLPPGRPSRLSALVQVDPGATSETQTSLSISPCESILVPTNLVGEIVDAYADRAYPYVDRFSVESS
jgi:CRP-like cAMP-binding protein